MSTPQTQDQKKNTYKDLGFMNGWSQHPPEYTACRAAGHDMYVSHPPGNEAGEHTAICHTCRIKWHWDSGD